MTKQRLWQTVRLCMIKSSVKRVQYLRKHHVFGTIGTDVTIMDRKVPLYARLIKIHNNVRIASHVTFATHDVTHLMLNKMYPPTNSCEKYLESVGCIEILDNVFIGTNVTILSNVRIGPNVIVAAGAVVTKDVAANSVVAGVPAKKICSFEEYLSRRDVHYPSNLAPSHQEVSEDLEKELWKSFEAQRNGNSYT